MNAKRFVSEPVILIFVAVVDLASVSALVICQRDMSAKETQAAAVRQMHEAVSARVEPAPKQLAHYSPAAINALLHPAANKTKDPAHAATNPVQPMTAQQ